MKKIKLFTLIGAGLTAATPLIAATACNNGSPAITDNVVWATKSQTTAAGDSTATFTYTCKVVGENDNISVVVKSYTGTEIKVSSQSFNKTTKTGKVTFKMTNEDEYVGKSSNFDVTVSCKGTNTWSEDITGLIVTYTPTSLDVVPVSALAFDATSGYITGLKQTNTDLSKCTKLAIPALINGTPVKGIATGAFKNQAEGVLPAVCQIDFDTNSNLIEIASNAFNGCDKLIKPLTLPKSLQNVGQNAFVGTYISSLSIEDGDTSLTLGESCFSGVCLTGNLSIPSRVTSIELNAFKGCAYLNGMLTLTPSTQLKNGAFQNCTKIGALNLEAFTSGSEAATKWAKTTGNNGCFENICGGDRQIPLIVRNNDSTLLGELSANIMQCSTADLQFTSSVTTSSTDFKYDNSGFIIGFADDFDVGEKTILYIPRYYKQNGTIYEVKGIETQAFQDGIRSKIDPKLTSLAFAQNPSFKTLKINAFAFASFPKQNDTVGGLYIPDSVTFIGASAFSKAAFGTISSSNKCALHLPKNLTSLGTNAFDAGNGNVGLCLPSDVIPSGLTSVPAYAFHNCVLLENKLIIPSELKTVGDNAFAFVNAETTISVTDPLEIDFTQVYLAPEWKGTHIFGSDSISTGNVTISIRDLVKSPSEKYNVWDQHEYLVSFKTLLTSKSGLSESKIKFNPADDTYERSLFITRRDYPTVLYSFATYADGTTIDVSNMEEFITQHTYGGNQVNAVEAKALSTQTIERIGEGAMSLTEDYGLDFAEYNVQSVIIPNTVTDIYDNFLSGQTNIRYIDFTSWKGEQFAELAAFSANAFSGLNNTDECFICVDKNELSDVQANYIVQRMQEWKGGLPNNWKALRI